MADWGKVNSVTEIRRLGPRGEVEIWYRYEVTTKGGITFTRELPEADTKPERVRDILSKRAAELDATKAV